MINIRLFFFNGLFRSPSKNTKYRVANLIHSLKKKKKNDDTTTLFKTAPIIDSLKQLCNNLLQFVLCSIDIFYRSLVSSFVPKRLCYYYYYYVINLRIELSLHDRSPHSISFFFFFFSLCPFNMLQKILARTSACEYKIYSRAYCTSRFFIFSLFFSIRSVQV